MHILCIVFIRAPISLFHIQNHINGLFIMFSIDKNIYNKKTKGPTIMELFTATVKLKRCFLTTRYVRCLHHG
jgi:hypothetical protein